MNKWDKHFLSLAKELATWSKDPSSKIGSIAVGDKRQILATGYNGFPRGIKDLPERLNTREEKYKYVVHAEQNLIYNACYVGISLDKATVYVYGLPVCSECCKGLIQVGVSKLVMQFPQPQNKLWLESFEMTKSLLNEANIEYNYYIINEG